MIAILSAFEPELSAVVRGLDRTRTANWGGGSLHTGDFAGHEVVAGATGVGTAMAAMAVQHVIDRFRPSLLLYCGIAGGIGPNVRPGDTVIATECLQYDLDATDLGIERGRVPGTAYGVLRADQSLVAVAATGNPATDCPVPDAVTGVHLGRIVSGDTFIGRSNAERYRFLADELDAIAVDMESAGAALTAEVNGVRWVVVRTISDMPFSSPARVNLRRFMPWAARNLSAFATRILQEV